MSKMPVSRKRSTPKAEVSFKPLAEGEPLETTVAFTELGEHLDGILAKSVLATNKAYWEAVSKLRLTAEAERRAMVEHDPIEWPEP